MLLLLLLLLLLKSADCVLVSSKIAIVPPSQILVLGSNGEAKLALSAKELRRYVYATTGLFPAIIYEHESLGDVGAMRSDVLVVATANALANLDGLDDTEGTVERIRTAGSDAHGRVCHPSGATVLVGSTPLAVLYAAYDWASSDLGVYFAIDGDRIPRREVASRVNSSSCIEMLSQPQFGQRGAVP
eukprot:COSAG02_NODE_6662_length_3432_cov_2.361236_1_plen_187_part_00